MPRYSFNIDCTADAPLTTSLKFFRSVMAKAQCRSLSYDEFHRDIVMISPEIPRTGWQFNSIRLFRAFFSPFLQALF